MRSAQLVLRFCAIAVAGALAATAAHVVTDVAGDYLLVHDTYDGLAHHSRGLLVGAVAVVLLVAAFRYCCEALDRRCPSRTRALSAVRDALGHPAAFAAASGIVALVALAGMEYFDCSLADSATGPAALLGGSIALGATSALLTGAVFGWLTHRAVRVAAKYETPIAGFILAVFEPAIRVCAVRSTRRSIETVPVTVCALILTRQGHKRGPPRPVFA